MALWKEIPGYEGLYLVSNDGRIYSLPKVVSNGRGEYVRDGQLLKPGLRGRDGLMYEFVILCKNGVSEHKSVHRLVAEAFIDNPNKYDVINHIDHDTLNNKVENLEWCTQQYNNEYGHNKPVCQYSVDGELLATYKSATYASVMTGISRTSINNALVGCSQSSGGYIWKYAREDEKNEFNS